MNIKIIYVSIDQLKPSEYNARKQSEEQTKALTEGVSRFGLVDPIICNSAPGRENVIIGGHFRLKVAKNLGFKEMPVVYVNITDLEKEKELNVRLNKNLGEFDFALLKDFGEDFLIDVGFSSEERDSIFDIGSETEQFDLNKELEKMNIKNISVKKGDRYETMVY